MMNLVGRMNGRWRLRWFCTVLNIHFLLIGIFDRIHSNIWINLILFEQCFWIHQELPNGCLQRLRYMRQFCFVAGALEVLVAWFIYQVFSQHVWRFNHSDLWILMWLSLHQSACPHWSFWSVGGVVRRIPDCQWQNCCLAGCLGLVGSWYSVLGWCFERRLPLRMEFVLISCYLSSSFQFMNEMVRNEPHWYLPF